MTALLTAIRDAWRAVMAMLDAYIPEDYEP